MMRWIHLALLATLAAGCGGNAADPDAGTDDAGPEADGDGGDVPSEEGADDAGETVSDEGVEADDAGPGDTAEADGGGDEAGDGEGGSDVPETSFESFRLWEARGPCRPDGDCEGFYELNSQGDLRVDRFNELPVVVHTARLSDTDRVVAIAILSSPDLVTLLDGAEPPCGPGPTDIFETMTLVLDGVTRTNSTPFCDLSPIDAARRVMRNMAATYLPP